MKIYKTIRLLLVIAGLSLTVIACDRDPDSGSTEAKAPASKKEATEVAEEITPQVVATIIQFNEVEAGVDPYVTRMIVSDRYIRIDDAAETDGFVLFDRLKKRIFSVVGENEMIVVVDPAYPLKGMPAGLKIRSEQIESKDVPMIAGVKPSYFQFYANDQLCYHVMASEGFLPEVTSALQSYQSVLAAQQQESLGSTPKELQTPCFLANYIYAPNKYISKGFPLEQWDESGYRRSLSGIEENVSISQSVFNLPDNYEYFSIGGGNVRM